MDLPAHSDAPPHGGNLAAARARFPGAPEPLLDLSTGIAPRGFPVPELPASGFARLPEPSEHAALCDAASRRYAVPPGAEIVAAPGTQILLPMIASLLRPASAAILGPTYAEHARAAALAGHAVREVPALSGLGGAALVTVVNPDNPTGRVLDAACLRGLAEGQRAAGGLLVVDEAFLDATEGFASAIPLTPEGGVVVLRSFGKFHGLAGLRLGFAVAAAPIAARLNALLGPWSVSGPALIVAGAAYADPAWAEGQRRWLAAEAALLDEVLEGAGLTVLGGTPLFRFVQAPPGMFARLGRAGILVREFPHWPDRLRIGLPPDAASRARLAAALR